MNTPEHGHTVCSIEDYDEGKQFIVRPDRLCVGGIYTLAIKPFRQCAQEAYLYTSKLFSVEPQEDTAKPYAVSIIFEDMYRPGVFEGPVPPLPATAEGLIAPQSSRPMIFDEAYLRHKFTAIDTEMPGIDEVKTIPFRAVTVPYVLPAAR